MNIAIVAMVQHKTMTVDNITIKAECYSEVLQSGSNVEAENFSNLSSSSSSNLFIDHIRNTSSVSETSARLVDSNFKGFSLEKLILDKLNVSTFNST